MVINGLNVVVLFSGRHIQRERFKAGMLLDLGTLVELVSGRRSLRDLFSDLSEELDASRSFSQLGLMASSSKMANSMSFSSILASPAELFVAL